MENYENFPSLMKTIKGEIQEAHRTPHISSIKKTTLRNIIIKQLKTNDKEKILKADKGKNTCYIQKSKDK